MNPRLIVFTADAGTVVALSSRLRGAFRCGGTSSSRRRRASVRAKGRGQRNRWSPETRRNDKPQPYRRGGVCRGFTRLQEGERKTGAPAPLPVPKSGSPRHEIEEPPEEPQPKEPPNQRRSRRGSGRRAAVHCEITASVRREEERRSRPPGDRGGALHHQTPASRPRSAPVRRKTVGKDLQDRRDPRHLEGRDRVHRQPEPSAVRVRQGDVHHHDDRRQQRGKTTTIGKIGQRF